MGDSTMSTVKLEGNTSGSGSVTLKSPNLSTDITVTLPEESLTLAGGGKHVLLDRSVMSNTSSYVFTATDATKYDSYYVEFNGIKSGGTTSLNVYLSDDGGSSYITEIGSNINQLRYATSAKYAVSGYLRLAYSLTATDTYGTACSGFVKLMNLTGSPDRTFNLIGQSSHNDTGANQIMSTFGAASTQNGNTQQVDINAFKIKMLGASVMSKGTISTFGVTNS